MQSYRIVKNSNVVKHIVESKHKGTLGHNYIFYANSSRDLEELMRGAAMAIMCDDDGCGNCEYCTKILKDSMMDVTVLPEGITSDIINDMIYSASLAPINKTGYKIYLIPYGESFFNANANKLLKLLEEPPEGCIFFIGARSESKLLSTIKSRSVQLRYIPDEQTSEIISEEYPELSPTQIRLTMKLTGNSFSETIKMLLNGDPIGDEYEKVLDMFKKLSSSKNVPDIVMTELFTKDNISRTLSFSEILFRDLNCLCSKRNNYLTAPSFLKGYMEILASGYNVNSISLVLEKINKAVEKLNFNCNSVAVASDLLMSILEVRYRCKL